MTEPATERILHMPEQIIYFDNAATSHPKPEVTYRAQDAYARAAANPGRGAHRLALGAARQIFETRLKAASFLHVAKAERLLFTAGCTQSINMVLKGIQFEGGANKNVVLHSALEHNAIMRPLRQLEKRGLIALKMIPYAQGSIISTADLEKALGEPAVKLCAFAHASNVTGEAISLKAIADLCNQHSVPLLVDAAQTAGRLDACLDHPGITFWCASAHKGLMSMPGLGLLYVAETADLEPLIAGGTGSGSEKIEMPDVYPDRLEAGTLPGPAIAALGASIEWLSEHGHEQLHKKELKLLAHLVNGIVSLKGITIFGVSASGASGSGSERTATFSFELEGFGGDQLADRLDTEYGIAVRSGLHCAALAHQTLGTVKTGLTRVSLGAFNNEAEIDVFINALKKIASQK